MLSAHTTLRVGGPAKRWLEADTEQGLIDAVAEADEAGEPLLLLSGGSNVVVGDAGFAGTVVNVATRGIAVRGPSLDAAAPSCGGVLVEVAAGEPWAAFVDWAVDHELVGIESLAGIPGAAGSTPIQNVGAYGQDVAQTLWHVRVWDRTDQVVRVFANSECGFGYRWSRFKAEACRYVVLGVTFQLLQGTRSSKIRYAELARRLGVEVGARASLVDVRDTVLELRRGKGMVLDEDDHDTWSAGSFFTNPILDADMAARLPDGAPKFPTNDGFVKTSAAWLIDQAGFRRGYGTPPATLSTKHVLALTNRGGATASDIVALAREVRDGVQEAWGVTLVPEPVFVGLVWD